MMFGWSSHGAGCSTIRKCLGQALTCLKYTTTMVSVKCALLGILPLISKPPPIIHDALSDNQSMFMSNFHATLHPLITTTVTAVETITPQLDIAGQRITVDWLSSLLDEDCLWQFRCVIDCLQVNDCRNLLYQ
jgi:hypothetical protein